MLQIVLGNHFNRMFFFDGIFNSLYQSIKITQTENVINFLTGLKTGSVQFIKIFSFADLVNLKFYLIFLKIITHRQNHITKLLHRYISISKTEYSRTVNRILTINNQPFVSERRLYVGFSMAH